MMSIGELLVVLDEKINATLSDPAHIPEELENLYATVWTIRDLLNERGETEEAHIASLNSKG